MPISILIPMLLPAVVIVVAVYLDARNRPARARVRARGRDERLRRLLRGDE